ncbi:hypothetical protein [Mesorhizobium sp. A623]
MGEIRAVRSEDLATVAGLFQRLLRKSGRPAAPSLEAYLAGLFLHGPDQDPEINSLIHIGDNGIVSGFIGALPLPMLVEDTPRRGAVAVALVADDRAGDHFAGARLMRAFLSGPQDISLTETANHTSATMLRKLRATVLPDHSLEWLRVIRPAGLAVELAAHTTKAARLFAPFALPVDALIRRGAESRWFNVGHALPGKALHNRDAGGDETLALIVQFTEAYAARPQWTDAGLRYRVAESRRKALYGSMVRRAVIARDGRPTGMFLYYGDPGRIGRVLQILSAPGQAGAVIDSMLTHAGERGMVALRGRTMPALLDAMLGRRFIFLHGSSSMVHARDPALLEPFRAGKAFFNGFAGESWSRLIGDSFD